MDIFGYPLESGYLWENNIKRDIPLIPPGPIFDKPVNPVPKHVSATAGDKVEHLETLEKEVQLKLRKKHLYLTRTKGTYKLKKIIFTTQIQRNWNVARGYPENLRLPDNRPPKYSAVPDFVELPAPIATLPVVPNHTATPRSFPRNFFRGVPRPIKYSAFPVQSDSEESSSDSSAETQYSSDKVIPEYNVVPFRVYLSEHITEEELADNSTEFVEIQPEKLQNYSSYFDKFES
jgi:hypothetical protein